MTDRIQSFEEYQQEYDLSIRKPEEFWADKAKKFTWHKEWDKVLEWNFQEPKVEWFKGAKLNIVENCLDRHLATRGDKRALIWEPNDPNGQAKTYTYKQLHKEVCRMANVLTNNGVQKGDRVCIYMPMIPELAFAVLACARVGAIHSVVFGGFSSNAIADRINDAGCSFVITSDGMYRGAKELSVKETVDEALESCSTVDKVLVVQYTHCKVKMEEGRDIWYHEALRSAGKESELQIMDAEDMLFILYTSGSTGKPKGVVHTCGGYMVYAEYTFRNVFQNKDSEVYWCTADIGWITGHSYILYGPLLAGATTVMFEGVPTWPDAGRFWQIVEKHKINIFYTAPTAIRALMTHNIDYVKKHDLSSLKVLGSVGEPINEEAWHWYRNNVGRKDLPIVDTWWQTETGGIMISPLAGLTPLKPSFATYPLPGVQPVLLDGDGNEIKENGVEGYLAIKFPWPGMIRTTYGDHERCRRTYFGVYKGYYFTGDGARRDEKGMYRVIGRVDDVINVSGHRFGTAEIENAIDEHPQVVESAVVGFPHEIKGQGIYAYVICAEGCEDEDKLRQEIHEEVIKQIGKVARPDKIQVVDDLPKTRSGKIMRRILRKVAEGETSSLGDTSTLLNPEVVESIIQGRRV
ncbi:acetate--CoA ligase [Nafulsella turpanensis]|uniref:acetate--CoA ligase n=1 Tax=Nafulsella turpanensis TaxID=1265690 RepID=UPI000346297E|nr:acetate--CoA ligase [Nafulsella turpanensis]